MLCVTNLIIIMKTTTSLRLDNDVIVIIKEISIKKGFTHPISKELPNLSKTINEIVREYNDLTTSLK